MNQALAFINDPLITPIYGVLVTGIIGFLLAIYRSIQQGVFDWTKLPSILDSMILKKVVPLAAMGAASFFITEGVTRAALQTAYLGMAGAALAAEIKGLIDKIRDLYTPTTLMQDQGLAPLNPEQKKSIAKTEP